MSDLYLPLYDKRFLSVYQPNYGFESDEKRFTTGFNYRIKTSSKFPTVEPIKIEYAKCTEAYLDALSNFYHARQLSDDFLINTTDLAAVNPYLRINLIGKWIFVEPFEINQETFGSNFVNLSVMVKQLI